MGSFLNPRLLILKKKRFFVTSNTAENIFIQGTKITFFYMKIFYQEESLSLSKINTYILSKGESQNQRITSFFYCRNFSLSHMLYPYIVYTFIIVEIYIYILHYSKQHLQLRLCVHSLMDSCRNIECRIFPFCWNIHWNYAKLIVFQFPHWIFQHRFLMKSTKIF